MVDETPRAPTSWLNQIVDRQSAKEAVIEFELPATAAGVELLIDNGEDKARLPLTLKRAE